MGPTAPTSFIGNRIAGAEKHQSVISQNLPIIKMWRKCSLHNEQHYFTHSTALFVSLYFCPGLESEGRSRDFRGNTWLSRGSVRSSLTEHNEGTMGNYGHQWEILKILHGFSGNRVNFVTTQSKSSDLLAPSPPHQKKLISCPPVKSKQTQWLLDCNVRFQIRLKGKTK